MAYCVLFIVHTTGERRERQWPPMMSMFCVLPYESIDWNEAITQKTTQAWPAWPTIPTWLPLRVIEHGTLIEAFRRSLSDQFRTLRRGHHKSYEERSDVYYGSSLRSSLGRFIGSLFVRHLALTLFVINADTRETFTRVFITVAAD